MLLLVFYYALSIHASWSTQCKDNNIALASTFYFLAKISEDKEERDEEERSY
jgi:hypothetical protein